MRQSEARDLRSFLQEPVEEIVVEGVKERSIDLQQDQLEDAHVGMRFTGPWIQNNAWDMLQDTGAPIQEVGVKFISGTNAQLLGTGVRFTTPWEGTGGQLHEVGARFTSPLGSSPLASPLGSSPLASPLGSSPLASPLGSSLLASPLGSSPLASPLGSSPLGANLRTTDDFTLQQTMPIASIPSDNVGARFTSPLGSSPLTSPLGSSPLTSPLGSSPLTSPSGSSPLTSPSGLSPLTSPSGSTRPSGSSPQTGSFLKPYRLQRYQSRGVAVSLSRSASGTLRLHPAGERRATAALAPAPHKIVPGEPSPALQSWERRRHALYTWLALLLLFLLVILGGIGLDSLIASYR